MKSYGKENAPPLLGKMRDHGSPLPIKVSQHIDS